MSHADDHDTTRRDFLYYVTGAAGAVVTGAAVWPMIDQMNPSADVQALSSIRVDVSELERGSQLTVKWLGKPVFIRRRTEIEITESAAVSMDDLPDPLAQNANLAGDAPGGDLERSIPPFDGENTGEWLVMIGVCTHLGCVPISDAGEYTSTTGVGGWFCPCHGSHYDTAGRIRKGPAPRNLDIPVATFVDETTIKLG